MPNYDFQCRNCDSMEEKFLRLRDLRDTIEGYCLTCDRKTLMDLVVSAPATEDWGNDGQGRWFEHLGPHGKSFKSKKEYRNYLKSNGLQEWSPKRGMPGCDP